jgi:HNH endonuclease
MRKRVSGRGSLGSTSQSCSSPLSHLAVRPHLRRVPERRGFGLAVDAKRYPVGLWQRFWTYVEERDGCWGWKRAHYPNGYAQFSIRKSESPEGKAQTLHASRMAYAIIYGPLGADLCVCHHCDNPSCMNPSHFFAGTRLHNRRDTITKGRRWHPYDARDRCSRGHLYTPETVRIRRKRSGAFKQRVCVTCVKIMNDRRQALKSP